MTLPRMCRYEWVMDPAGQHVLWDKYTNLPVVPEDQVLILMQQAHDGTAKGTACYRGGVRCSRGQPLIRLCRSGAACRFS